MDLLPLFEGYTDFHALELGSGVGRNLISVSQNFSKLLCVKYLQEGKYYV